MNLRNGRTSRLTLVDGSTMEGAVMKPWWWWLVPAMWFVVRLADPVFFDPRSGEPIPAAGTIIVRRRNIVFMQIGE